MNEKRNEYAVLASVFDAGLLPTIEVLVRGLDVETGRYLRISDCLRIVFNANGDYCYELTDEGYEYLGELRDELYELALEG